MDEEAQALALLMGVVNRRGADGEHVYSNDDFKRALPLLVHVLGVDEAKLGPRIQRAMASRPSGPPPASLIRELQQAVLVQRRHKMPSVRA